MKIPYDFQTYQSPEGPGPPQETERRGKRKRTRERLTDLKGPEGWAARAFCGRRSKSEQEGEIARRQRRDQGHASLSRDSLM